MALGDGIRYNVRSVTAPERTRLKNAILALQARNSPVRRPIPARRRELLVQAGRDPSGHACPRRPEFLPVAPRALQPLRADAPRCRPRPLSALLGLERGSARPVHRNFMGSASGDAGAPWAGTVYDPAAANHRDDTFNPADPPNELTRGLPAGGPRPRVPTDADIIAAADYPPMRALLESKHNDAHTGTSGAPSATPTSRSATPSSSCSTRTSTACSPCGRPSPDIPNGWPRVRSMVRNRRHRGCHAGALVDPADHTAVGAAGEPAAAEDVRPSFRGRAALLRHPAGPGQRQRGDKSRQRNQLQRRSDRRNRAPRRVVSRVRLWPRDLRGDAGPAGEPLFTSRRRQTGSSRSIMGRTCSPRRASGLLLPGARPTRRRGR